MYIVHPISHIYVILKLVLRNYNVIGTSDKWKIDLQQNKLKHFTYSTSTSYANVIYVLCDLISSLCDAQAQQYFKYMYMYVYSEKLRNKNLMNHSRFIYMFKSLACLYTQKKILRRNK